MKDGGLTRRKGAGCQSYLHFNVGSKDCAHAPFHLWLALPDAKSTGTDWYMQDGCGFVAAALLKAIRESQLIDIKPGIEWLYRNYQVHKLKTARQLATQV